MKVFYLTSDGAKLVKKNNNLVLEKDKLDSYTIFPYQVEQLYIIGNINITSSALKLLMKHKIETVLLGKNGKFYGKLTFKPAKNVFLRIKQYKLLDDEEFKIKFAKVIVMGKIKNQIIFLRKLYNKKKINKVKKIREKLINYYNLVEKATSLEKIRGYEGISSKNYFNVFEYAINPEFAVFNGRSKNPPLDNVNAVLSFIYTLLYFRVSAFIEAEGLDTHVGYLHTLDYGRESLAFDLMEEYRTPIGEALTVSLFNLGILAEKDFREVEFSSEDEEYPLELDENEKPETQILKKGVLLNNSGMKKVIAQFEKRMSYEYFYPPEGKKLLYKELIHHQIKHFKRIITGEEKEYKPIVMV